MLKENHTRIFLRDDDVGALTPALTGFMDIFAQRNLPVSYQIIPAALTEDCAEHLKFRRERAAGLFEFCQHGLTHEMTVGGRRVFYEFGPERSYQEQLEIIQAGQAILRERLAAHFNSSIFTPPQHKYDYNTLVALKASGVRVLSASSYASRGHRIVYGVGGLLGRTRLGRSGISYHGRTRRDVGLAELSIAVPVDNGSVRMKTAGAVLAAIGLARRRMSVVGLMFHHNAYPEREDRLFLAELADGLGSLHDVSFHLLGDIAREHAPSGVSA
ncbi:DUF2334 domain-containing protein [Phenylobacterium koreense]|uniref:Polysaccharide deacetylase n=1 Tax=Phenylobacterium koreense TaxID=266125 RepID=A0ABV2ENH1_9CAUL